MRHETTFTPAASPYVQWRCDMFSLSNCLRKNAASNDSQAREYQRQADQLKSTVIGNIANRFRNEAARCRRDARWYLNHIRAMDATR